MRMSYIVFLENLNSGEKTYLATFKKEKKAIEVAKKAVRQKGRKTYGFEVIGKEVGQELDMFV